nr:MAG TPA: hypothetical protein [Caudoviricetes sp.]
MNADTSYLRVHTVLHLCIPTESPVNPGVVHHVLSLLYMLLKFLV